MDSGNGRFYGWASLLNCYFVFKYVCILIKCPIEKLPHFGKEQISGPNQKVEKKNPENDTLVHLTSLTLDGSGTDYQMISL
jgi:hypothetical protein